MRLLSLFLCFVAALEAGTPQIVSVRKIWDAGQHNAFTDLIRFHNAWYCTFRESEAHVGGNGKLRVLVSSDGEQWKPAALLAEDGVDLRDPKLSLTPDGRLMIVAGGSVYEGKTLKGRRPRVAFSKNGHDWTAPQPILAEGDWLWRVTWHKGRAYGVSYRVSGDSSTARDFLFSSVDGVHYKLITEWDVSGGDEATVRFVNGDEMMALVRREADDGHAWIGTSRPPYKQWQWHATGHRVGGPNFIELPDGSLWAGGRESPGGAKTVLARMTP
ncbi:MAG TPA: hypothetical protein VEU62_02530, partial [Bryobacterales bacterium]|nr:hypothetical protein [Bryobacterales bacterium]